jgi:hypothetical protein
VQRNDIPPGGKMGGTFENPPIILEQDRFKLGLTFIATAAITVFFAVRLATCAGRSMVFHAFLVI